MFPYEAFHLGLSYLSFPQLNSQHVLQRSFPLRRDVSYPKHYNLLFSSLIWTDSTCYNEALPSDEMSLITNNIKNILNIKIKARHDSYTDQYMRIFMVKMCVVSSLVMGVDWFHDTVSCMVPQKSDLKPNFIHSACWIQGKGIWNCFRITRYHRNE